jgi:P-type Cu2+ transporter
MKHDHSEHDKHQHEHQQHEEDESLQEKAMDHSVHGRDVEHDAQDRADEAMPEMEHPRDHQMDQDGHAGHDMRGAHEGHGVDHSGHEEMFRKRFWVSLLLSIPVLLYSPMLQMWFGFSMPEFPGSQWISSGLSIVIFFYGGVPFLQMAVPELRNRQPGMMTLISLAISVAFIYSLAAEFWLAEETFFWELVTLIDIMLLGHWIEMRSVRQASGALSELAKLMPDTAERIGPNGETEKFLLMLCALATGCWCGLAAVFQPMAK